MRLTLLNLVGSVSHRLLKLLVEDVLVHLLWRLDLSGMIHKVNVLRINKTIYAVAMKSDCAA